jgi:hypothetical protein
MATDYSTSTLQTPSSDACGGKAVPEASPATPQEAYRLARLLSDHLTRLYSVVNALGDRVKADPITHGLACVALDMIQNNADEENLLQCLGAMVKNPD